jgi:hypothetical protein
MKKTARILGITAGALALLVTLSGCFAIPLADGRSPFDDPFGPSKASVDASLPAIEEAIKAVEVDPYVLEVVRGSDNCEGLCNLSPEVQFTYPNPPLTAEELVPADLIAEVMVAAIPAVDGQPLRISAYPGAGSLELVEEVVSDVPKEIGGFYYSDHSDAIFIPADKLAEAKVAAESYLRDNSQ